MKKIGGIVLLFLAVCIAIGLTKNFNAVMAIICFVLAFLGYRIIKTAPKKIKTKAVIKATPAATKPKAETHKIAGVSFRQDDIRLLAHENPDYDCGKSELQERGLTDERIYQYDFPAVTARLEFEPENPHDPNAIKVLANDTHIGYIKAGSTAHVRKLIEQDVIAGMSLELSGGKYKYATETDNGKIELDKDEVPFFAELTIFVKQ